MAKGSSKFGGAKSTSTKQVVNLEMIDPLATFKSEQVSALRARACNVGWRKYIQPMVRGKRGGCMD